MAPVRTKRLVASLFLTAAVVITPMAVAAPASASQGSDCYAMAKALGYRVGPKVAGACGFPAEQPSFGKPWVTPHPGCMRHLENAGISNWNHRFAICMKA
ncbi:hypothetical protein ACWGCK_16450 [Streptomyces virginiae]|uniref:hypothetical protein n=1 Tax=Streptomyces virginiae TaxID=1961 RepID=UPI003682AAA5